MKSYKDHEHVAEAQDGRKCIRLARGRCQMCGRTVAKHGVTLVASNGLWVGDAGGGPNCPRAVCVDCSRGLRAYFGSLSLRSDSLRAISSHDSVHVRIGELLKAVGIGKRTPSPLIAAIAGQRAWKSRLRELRQPPFRWKVAAIRYKAPSGRAKCDYLLIRERPWPRKKNA